MNIMVLHRFFPPDSNPYGSLLNTIAGWWAESGHRVIAVAGGSADVTEHARPHDQLLKVERKRVLSEGTSVGRLVNWVLFPFRASWRVFTVRPAPDVVMCGTMPQVLMGWFVSLAARFRRASFVYHCMDLHPEVGKLSGEFANPLVFKVLRWMDTQTMRRAARIVVLSSDMRDSVAARDISLMDKTSILNNFALPLPDDGEGATPPLPANGDSRVLRVVFAGNLGRFQGLETLIEAHASLPDEVRVQLLFMGRGRRAAGLQERADALGTSGSVVFLQEGSAAAAATLMRSAHLGVVSLVPRIIQYAFPSKTAAYLSEGLPLLVICDRNSELVRQALKGGYGFVAEPGDVAGVRNALVSAYTTSTSSEWETVAEAARRAGRSQRSEAYRERWVQLVETLDAH